MNIRPDDVVLVADAYLGHWARTHQTAKRTTDAHATFYFADDDEIQPLVAHQTRIGAGTREPGKRFRLFVVACDDDAAADDGPGEEAAEWGQHARDLKLSGFLRAPDVWRVLGSDAVFRDWVTYQPSIVSGGFSEHDSRGEGRNVACHVRRAGESGTAYKPAWACVPMTDAEHRLQHSDGELAVFLKRMRHKGQRHQFESLAEPYEAAAWFDQQRIATVERWAWETLRDALGVASMRQAHPADVLAWAQAEGVAHLLPRCYREVSA